MTIKVTPNTDFDHLNFDDLDVILDRFSFTMAIPVHLQKRALGRLKRIAKGKSKSNKLHAKGENIGPMETDDGHSVYENGWYLPIDEDAFLTIHMRDPIFAERSLRNPLRVEISPKHFDRASIKKAIKIIRYLTFMPEDLPISVNMKITRMDFAIDVPGLHMEQFQMRVACGRELVATNCRFTGELSDCRVGAKRSKKQTKAYNKILLMCDGDMELYDSRDQDLTRFEIKCRGAYFQKIHVLGLDSSFDEFVGALLDKQKDPFHMITIFSTKIKWQRIDSKLFDRKFRARLRKNGVNYAIRRVAGDTAAETRSMKARVSTRVEKVEYVPFGKNQYWNKQVLTTALLILAPFFNVDHK